jgi:hypothetical protein
MEKGDDVFYSDKTEGFLCKISQRMGIGRFWPSRSDLMATVIFTLKMNRYTTRVIGSRSSGPIDPEPA